LEVPAPSTLCFTSGATNLTTTTGLKWVSLFNSYCQEFSECISVGRAVAEAVSRWLPTTAARVRVRAEHVGFVVDKEALGQVFSEYFSFPFQSSFHQFLHHHNHPGLAQ
jgi:hypothetical protein